MTDNDDPRERVARINTIAAELIDMKNNKADVHQMAEAAKKLIPGQAVQHITHPNVKGVVGNSVTEGLQVAVTQPDNLDGAICFADPRNLRLAALSATPIEALQQRVERLEVALRDSVQGCPQCEGEGEYTLKRIVVPCEFCEIARAALGDDVG